ncbi:alpha/beta hydrolase (plasmid) [Photobacterium sp. GJ3]|uniref:alpha/beta fold hydrolase n=1 Tax=Photobacterium sp. GJ3 TaxID=2829502 RepID=UPI001B8AE864|nr:alpha/beta hydrolase [Photobacterium sp. GJ3]QUJ70078.1 alpha/beta hydrolase [Photobacterium sp. GJ3]
MSSIYPASKAQFEGICYLDIGQGPALVLGHPLMWDSAMWRHQLAELSQHFRCIVPDFWGHGDSDPAPGATATLADYAASVLALLDHLKIQQFGLVGHGLGSSWAIECCVQAPGRVKALVLMNSFAGLEPEVVNLKYQAMLRDADESQAFRPASVESFTALQFGQHTLANSPELIEDFRQRLGAIQGKQAQALAQAGRMWFGRRDSFEDAEKLALPCLLIAGAEDKIRSVLESYLMLDGMTGSQLHLIEGAGHLCPLEKPGLVTEHLMNFCLRVMD